MTDEAFERAREIKEKMNKLTDECKLIANAAGQGWYWRRLLKIRKPKFIVTHYDDEYIMDLSNEDIKALIQIRTAKYLELKNELEKLK